MPQTSPMNWMIITIMFFIMVNTMSTLSKGTMKPQKNLKTSMKYKNIMWKW